MRTITRWGLVVALAALGSGCNMSLTGRLVGFVVNGQTGERLNFFGATGQKNNLSDNANAKSQVYAVIAGRFKRAIPCGAGDSNDSNAIQPDGCFQIDGIPDGTTFPLFAEAPDFERFVGELDYPILDAEQNDHQIIGNIRLFPKDFKQDYRILVSFLGQPVQGARVVCQYRPATTNSLQVDGSFLTPRNTAAASTILVADSAGVVVVPQANLVNGAQYFCEGFLDAPLDGRQLSGSISFTAGVTTPVIAMALATTGTPDQILYALSSNVDNDKQPQGADARLIVTLNRPAEFVPQTTDCQQAFLDTQDTDNDSNTAALVANTSSNNASEQVNAELSADGLTLTLSLRPLQRAFDPDDRGTSVSFFGIALRPRAAADQRIIRTIGSIAGCAQAQAYGTASALDNLRTGANQSATVQVF